MTLTWRLVRSRRESSRPALWSTVQCGLCSWAAACNHPDRPDARHRPTTGFLRCLRPRQPRLPCRLLKPPPASPAAVRLSAWAFLARGMDNMIFRKWAGRQSHRSRLLWPRPVATGSYHTAVFLPSARAQTAMRAHPHTQPTIKDFDNMGLFIQKRRRSSKIILPASTMEALKHCRGLIFGRFAGPFCSASNCVSVWGF